MARLLFQYLTTLLLVFSPLVVYSLEEEKEIDLYSSNARTKISSKWVAPKIANVKSLENVKDSILVKFSFEIKKDGSIQNLRIIDSSKIKEIDDSALNAVKSSAPFPALPKGLDVLVISYGFKFDPPTILKKNEEKQKIIPDKETYKKELDDYYKSAFDKIGSNWEKPNVLLNDTTRAIIGFEVNRDGSIKNLKVVEGSDFPELDESGLNAVKKSLPFFPIPEKIPFDLLSINYTFALDKVAVYDTNSPYLSEKEKVEIKEDSKKAEGTIKQYHENIVPKINKLWDPPQDKYFALMSNLVEVEFYILSTGELYRPNIVISSGDWELDQSAIQTLELASPFPPLPSEIKTDRFKFTHRFLLKQNY